MCGCANLFSSQTENQADGAATKENMTRIVIIKSEDPTWPRWAVVHPRLETVWFRSLEAAEKHMSKLQATEAGR